MKTGKGEEVKKGRRRRRKRRERERDGELMCHAKRNARCCESCAACASQTCATRRTAPQLEICLFGYCTRAHLLGIMLIIIYIDCVVGYDVL